MKTKETKEPTRPLPVPVTPAPAQIMIEPIADDDRLVESFKRYVALKDKLLEDHDYSWIVKWKIGKSLEQQWFTHRANAEAFGTGLQKKNIDADLEKRIKKSGCLKLKKAFGFSIQILNCEETENGVKYTVRATAPNGQTEERTGRCDRRERGRDKSPFDHLDSTALTRATNRATMALLGGETTAEEWGEEPSQLPEKATEPQKGGETPKKAPTARTSEEMRRDVEKKFTEAKPKPPGNPRGRFWAELDKLFSDKEKAKGVTKKLLIKNFGTESTKALTDKQLNELLDIIKKQAVKS